MSDKHAAALAALDAGCEVLYAPHNHYVAWTNDEQGRKKLGVGATPIDALAAAAEALGLSSRYVVTEVGRVVEVETFRTHPGTYPCSKDHGPDCADGCNSEESRRNVVCGRCGRSSAEARLKTVRDGKGGDFGSVCANGCGNSEEEKRNDEPRDA